MSLVGDREGAQEVAQESWLAIVKGLSKLQDPARFCGWSYRIVQNKAADWIRRHQRQRQHEVEAVSEPQAPSATNSHGGEAELLQTAISRLSPDQRKVIELFYLEELPVREISELLRLAEGTVKSRLYHARMQVKQTLEDPR